MLLQITLKHLKTKWIEALLALVSPLCSPHRQHVLMSVSAPVAILPSMVNSVALKCHVPIKTDTTWPLTPFDEILSTGPPSDKNFTFNVLLLYFKTFTYYLLKSPEGPGLSALNVTLPEIIMAGLVFWGDTQQPCREDALSLTNSSPSRGGEWTTFTDWETSTSMKSHLDWLSSLQAKLLYVLYGQ